MTNIILHRKTDDPFSRVPHTVLNDPQMSWKAKGLLSYLVGRPINWTINTQDLVNRSTDGENATRSALRELRDAGYARLERVTNAGKVTGWNWMISDTPIFLKPDGGFPDVEKPDVEKPDVENRPINKKEGNKKDNNKNELALRIYEAYPKKIGRGHALKAILAALKKESFDFLLQRTEAYARSLPVVDQYTPYPATWFNAERYLDTFTVSKKQPRKSAI